MPLAHLSSDLLCKEAWFENSDHQYAHRTFESRGILTGPADQLLQHLGILSWALAPVRRGLNYSSFLCAAEMTSIPVTEASQLLRSEALFQSWQMGHQRTSFTLSQMATTMVTNHMNPVKTPGPVAGMPGTGVGSPHPERSLMSAHKEGTALNNNIKGLQETQSTPPGIPPGVARSESFRT
mmetsp:Transcript_43974/g.70304  ORF Transcript_43974/g.70304 Transcript_43974/m.70304 type:complete len:181 (+) Transcript_43974:54-596(+)